MILQLLWKKSSSLTANLSFERAVDPGLVKVNPLSEHLTTVDVKIQIVEVPRQVCMTKDNVTLNLTSVIYYHITSPHKAAFGIANVRTALVERTQTTLRHVVGARVLQDVIERREEIAQSIHEIIESVASGWGAQVESMLIKDIIFSNDLQDSLSMAAQAKRIGESKVIAARAEVESAKLMRQVFFPTSLVESRETNPVNPRSSRYRLPISYRPRQPCRFAISKPCSPWQRAPTARSYSCLLPTRPSAANSFLLPSRKVPGRVLADRIPGPLCLMRAPILMAFSVP
jgi:SPFH domain / Band 7 family